MSRLAAGGLSRSTVLAGALLPTCVTALVSQWVGAGVDRTIGIAGCVLAVATFVLTQWQAAGPRDRRVIMIPKSRSPFSASVQRGLAELISASPTILLSTVWPPPAVTDELEWQLEQLRSADLVGVDGLVIVPATDDERLWGQIARISRAGVFVVVVDSKPKNSFFSARQAPRPCFVGSDFSAGGELVGAEIARLLKENPSARAVVALGPRSSWPGTERSRCITHQLCLAGVSSRTVFLELENWKKDRVAPVLGAQVQATFDELARESPDAVLVVYCGNDKILEALDRSLLENLAPDRLGRVRLLGYDGALSVEGTLLAEGCTTAIATVDTQPELQGRAAAEVLTEEYSGVLVGRESRYIQPRLMRFDRAAKGNGAR